MRAIGELVIVVIPNNRRNPYYVRVPTAVKLQIPSVHRVNRLQRGTAAINVSLTLGMRAITVHAIVPPTSRRE
jgi:hypothetical protein